MAKAEATADLLARSGPLGCACTALGRSRRTMRPHVLVGLQGDGEGSRSRRPRR